MFDNFSLDCCSGPLADEPGQLIAIPVIPVPDTKSKNVLVLEEGETVLAVPVVGLVLHPVEPGHDDDDGRFDENEPDQVISAPL